MREAFRHRVSAVAILMLLLLATHSVMGDPGTRDDPIPSTSGSLAVKDVKGYLLGTLEKIERAADDFVRDAAAYQQLVNANGGDPLRAFAASPDEMTRLIASLREGYKKMDSFGYETIEGIVAGVPALSDFDVYLDSGVPQDQVGGGTPVAPVVVSLPDGGKIDHEGCLFTYLVEPMLWGSNKKLVVPADLDHDGKIGARESLPRAEALTAVANDVRAQIHQLRQTAVAWRPSTSDYFSAIITMTPTLSGYFDDWKESRYAGSGKFMAVSRVSDMRGIMFSVAVLYGAVRSEVAAKDSALASSIQRGFDGILSFIDRVALREKKAGAQMTPAEIDELGEQAKQKADKLVPQVEQAAAILDVNLSGA
jgi:imelysin